MRVNAVLLWLFQNSFSIPHCLLLPKRCQTEHSMRTDLENGALDIVKIIILHWMNRVDQCLLQVVALFKNRSPERHEPVVLTDFVSRVLAMYKKGRCSKVGNRYFFRQEFQTIADSVRRRSLWKLRLRNVVSRRHGQYLKFENQNLLHVIYYSRHSCSQLVPRYKTFSIDLN